MRKLKVYPVHPCLICGEPTTIKTYCKLCLAIASKPQHDFRHSSLSLYADEQTNKKHRRNEDSDGLGGKQR